MEISHIFKVCEVERFRLRWTSSLSHKVIDFASQPTPSNVSVIKQGHSLCNLIIYFVSRSSHQGHSSFFVLYNYFI